MAFQPTFDIQTKSGGDLVRSMDIDRNRIRRPELRRRHQCQWLVALSVILLAPAFWPTMAIAQFNVPQTVQLPTFGVSIDADGVLTAEMFAEPGGRLFAERVFAAHRALEPELIEPSEMRKVSLRRLEEEIDRRLANGESPTDAMNKLAGLTRIEYVFIYPEESDIVIAGPAEGWIEDSSGRAVGIHSGRPIVLLEDLLVGLRLFAPGERVDTWVGCTIDPTQDGLRRLAEFHRTIPRSIPRRGREIVGMEIARGIKDSLGMANVRLFGLSPETHMANVLVEADYRMKLIGIGIEPPPVRMETFLSASRSGRHEVLQRWWFTPNYECVKTTDDRRAFQLVGQGVQLLSEEFQIGRDGRLVEGEIEPSRASRLYTQAFTRKYEEIAAMSPVYAQLRNMVDVLIVCAFLNKFDRYADCGWMPATLLDEDQLPTEIHPQPNQAPCAVNAVWRGDRFLAPAGGGVSIQAIDALNDENLIEDERDQLYGTYSSLSDEVDREAWWWD